MSKDQVIALGPSDQERQRLKRAEWSFAGALASIAVTGCFSGQLLYPLVHSLGLKSLALPAMLGMFWIPPAVLVGGSAVFLMRSSARKRRMSKGGCWKCGYTIVAADEAIGPKPPTRKCPECARETQLFWIPRGHAVSMRRRGFGVLAVRVNRVEPNDGDQGR